MNKVSTIPVIKSIELLNRLKLQYVEQGDTAGVPVIMLHGITDSLRSFELTLRSLPSHIRAYAISQRGHGDSDRPVEGYHPVDFAADVAAFMDALRIDRAVIAGHSMGSHMAQRFALDYPNRTLGLALMGSFFRFRGNPAVDELSDAVSNLEDPIAPGFALEFQLSTLARNVPQAFLDTVVNESLKVPARVWRAALEGIITGDHSADLGKIKAPTLIAWGDQDAFCPRGDQDSFVKAINGARLEVYQGGGHAFHWEEPERFASDLAALPKASSNRAISRSIQSEAGRRVKIIIKQEKEFIMNMSGNRASYLALFVLVFSLGAARRGNVSVVVHADDQNTNPVTISVK